MVRVKKEPEITPGPEFKVTRIPMPKVLPKPRKLHSHMWFWFAIVILAVLFLQSVVNISMLQRHYDNLDEIHGQLVEAINKNPDNYENITN